MLLDTLVKVLLALLPRAVMAVMHTTTIRASMTAYSTAVGPSSRCRKFFTRSMSSRIALLPFQGVMKESTGDHPGARADGGVQGHVAERFVGVGAHGRDGREAHHDDQGQHDGILDRSRAVLSLQKSNHG